MKHDEEYNSYKFNSSELCVIIRALNFYNQYSPLLEQGQRDYINDLVKSFEKSCENRLKSSECVPYTTQGQV